MSIGSKIKALRRANDLTQDELAELLDAFSHYAMTKFGVAAFVVLTYLFAKNAKKDVS